MLHPALSGHLQRELQGRAAVGALDPRTHFHASPKCLAAADTAGSSLQVFGQAVIYGEESEPLNELGTTLRFIAGCFRDCLEDPKSDPRVLFNHQHGFVIGRASAKTCKFTDGPASLDFEATGPNATWFLDLKTLMQRGDINQSSVACTILKGRWESSGGHRVLVVDKASIIEASIVAFPLFRQTTAQLRSARLALDHARLRQLMGSSKRIQ